MHSIWWKWKNFLWPETRLEVGRFEEELHFQARKFFFFITTLCTFVWLPYVEIDGQLNPNAEVAIPFRYAMSVGVAITLLALCGFSKYLRSHCEWLMRAMVYYILISVAIITAASEAHLNYVAGYFLCLLTLSMVPQPLWSQWGITIISVGLYLVACEYFGVTYDTVAKRYGLQDTISVFVWCV